MEEKLPDFLRREVHDGAKDQAPVEAVVWVETLVGGVTVYRLRTCRRLGSADTDEQDNLAVRRNLGPDVV